MRDKKNHVYHLIIGIIVQTFFLLPHTGNSQLINYGGKDFYLNGANIAWNNYGWDFGDNSAGLGGGNGYDATWWDNTFTDVESYGGNCVRVWVHCKGEHNPLFDGAGHCTGLNNNFYSNLDAMLQSAENHNLMVIVCLFDFLLVDVGREDVIKDTSKTHSYINNALIPMVQHYNAQCNLLAWEIINEPEWIMQGIPGGGNHGSAGISITQMQRFVGMCASAIHANSSKMVTVGSASLKWNSNRAPATGKYWNNISLKAAAYDDNAAILDFYQIHYYDWMGTGLSPYANLKSFWGLDKPTLIGETGNEGYYTYQQQFDYGYSNGYAGCLPWAYQSGGAAAWADFNNEMLNFRNNNSGKVDFDCTLLTVSKSSDRSEFILKTVYKKGEAIFIEGMENPQSIKIIDMNGRNFYDQSLHSDQSEWTIENKLNSGFYFLFIETPSSLYPIKILIE
jgi:hypothetical protein